MSDINNALQKKLSREEWIGFCRHKIVILDGATGTMLQKNGMPKGVCPEKWILENPHILLNIQKDYLRAGTDILYAPTFTANRVKLEEYGLEKELLKINKQLAEISIKAREEYYKEIEKENKQRPVYLAGDISMTGKQLKPMGNMDFEELVDIYKEQIGALSDYVDLFAIETMMSLQECRAALLAAKETCPEIPVMVTLTFNEDGRTLYGTDPETAMVVTESMGADAVGINCSAGPDTMLPLIRQMRKVSYVPVIAKPNAGLPKLVDGESVYEMGAEEFSEEVLRLVKEGVGIVGGCCGSTPEHIKCTARIIEKYMKENPDAVMPEIYSGKGIRALTTEQRTTHIGLTGNFMVIGERINPTGKKLLQESLRKKDVEMVGQFAVEQEEKGASILDVNMGMNGIDEKEMMMLSMEEVMNQSTLPISIDSSNISVIEAALRKYPGRALINSVSLEKEKFEKLIPMAKKYGAMFILLPLSEAGLPKDIDEKKDIIEKILKRAFSLGLTGEDIIVDALVNTVGANKKGGVEALETIKYCREKGLATVCGLSNISFGLPERAIVNSAFLSIAISAGLTMAIANPSQSLLMGTMRAADLLLNKEDADLYYIQQVEKEPVVMGGQAVGSVPSGKNGAFGKSGASVENSAGGGTVAPDGKEHGSRGGLKEQDEVFSAVVKGNQKKIVELTKKKVEGGSEPASILDDILIPAINHVGDLFDRQIYFLPQLINSARTMELAVEYLEPLLKKNEDGEPLGTIVMATVEGDIHDIGKNLVVLMLKNYGFRVIDMGKDVKCSDIIECARRENADIIGLSALMTTTMTAMKDVVEERNKKIPDVKIIIGGAVITESYAEEIGADGYSKDAQDAVKLVKKLLEKEPE